MPAPGLDVPTHCSDLKRPLDKEGKEQCLRLAYVLNAMKISFDAVYSSPLKRSLQTAQLVATETGYEPQILSTPALAPDARFADFLQLVHQANDFENVLLVGHNPQPADFSRLLARMASTRRRAGNQGHCPQVRLLQRLHRPGFRWIAVPPR